MCGIAGIAELEGFLPTEVKAALVPMTSALAHRGPGGDGFWSDASVAFGHRRLAIIDREGGKQPLSNEDGSVWVTFNGEIYNHHEVRELLESKGHRFRTRSDTEVIVHAYEEFGPSCVERFEGMFAFGVYDQRKRALLLARDRLGKKPLFYANLAGVLHFASEIKAIAQSPLWDGTPDLTALEGYLSLGYFIAPATAYRAVRKLEPGHWLLLERGQLTIRRYWQLEEFDTYRGTEDQAVEELTGLLAERTRERLESEVPLGAFLSGGIDSGLVVSMMAEAMDRPVITTSVGFAEAAHNELALAEVTASAHRTDHHPYVVQPELDDLLDQIVTAFDEPFADASAIPTYYVSREARRHVTVALSGDGGDECFGGYDFRYLPHAMEARVRPWLAATGLQAAASSLGSGWPRSSRMPRPLRLGGVLRNLGAEPADAYFSDLCFLKPTDAAGLMGRTTTRLAESPVYEPVTAAYRQCPSRDAVQCAQYADTQIYLPNDPLVKVDRMSMQNSLEVRSPLLDRRIVELAFRLPETLKRAGSRGKHLLRRVAARRLPHELLTAPKRGFTAPIGSWIAGTYRHRFEAEVLASRSQVSSLIDLHKARQLFSDHVAGRRDHSFALWALWMLERWASHQSSRQLSQMVEVGS